MQQDVVWCDIGMISHDVWGACAHTANAMSQ